MSDPRDDLAALITQALAAVKRPGTASILLDVADAIIAAGWTPPTKQCPDSVPGVHLFKLGAARCECDSIGLALVTGHTLVDVRL